MQDEIRLLDYMRERFDGMEKKMDKMEGKVDSNRKLLDKLENWSIAHEEKDIAIAQAVESMKPSVAAYEAQKPILDRIVKIVIAGGVSFLLGGGLMVASGFHSPAVQDHDQSVEEISEKAQIEAVEAVADEIDPEDLDLDKDQ